MQLLALNSNLETIKYLSYLNLQWNRKYYTFGEFSVQIDSNIYNSEMKYIFTKDRPELGIINKVEYTEDYKGKLIQLSGYFYEYKLIDKIIFPRYTNSGNIEVVARNLVSTYKDDIPKLVLGTLNNLGNNIRIQESDAELGKYLSQLLQTQELSYKTIYDYVNDQVKFEVYQGVDRTQDQTTNTFCTFSTGFRNMNNIDFILDDSNYKNYAVIVGNGEYEEGNQITVNVDKSSGGYKKKIYVDATSEKYNSAEQTLAEYQQLLTQKGEEELLKYALINTVTFDTDISNLKYMVDFDLGDKCDIIIENIEMSFQARIIEIYEVFKDGKHEINLKFGEKIPTIYTKARLK